MDIIGNPALYNYYGFSQFVVYHVKVFKRIYKYYTKGYEEFHNSSYRNEAEVKLCTEIFIDHLHKFPKTDLNSFGIVSPYSA